MEILSEHTEWAIFTFVIVGISLFTLLFLAALIGGIAVTFEEGASAENVIGTLAIGIITAVLITCLVLGIKQGPETKYKAIVTDYNEVYDAGYTVVNTEGKIVTLTKE